MEPFDQRTGKDLMVDLNRTYNEVEHGINSSKIIVRKWMKLKMGIKFKSEEVCWQLNKRLYR